MCSMHGLADGAAGLTLAEQYDVRTLPDLEFAGSDPRAVQLSGAAEFPARATTWRRHSRCRSCGCGKGKRQFALVRWGLIPPWVKDPKTFSAADQCARRFRARQAVVPQRHAAAALPVSGRRLLRMEGRRRAQTALSRSCRRPAGRSHSRVCGKAGSGRMARKWKRRRSSRPTPTARCAIFTIACRSLSRRRRSTCGSIAQCGRRDRRSAARARAG